VTVGIIACVQVTTTTAPSVETTSPVTVIPSASSTATTSGTTTLPTSVQTTTNCQRQMAQVGGVYVSSVSYSVQPVSGTNIADLTNPNSNGVTFQSVPNTNGLFGTNSQPLYTIDLTFNPAGVNSLSSVVASVGTNVDKFSVEFFDLLNPTQLIPYSTQPGALPVSYTSTNTNSQAPLVNFPDNAPSDLAGIRITILSTKNNQ
jgi:hypothetical protein